MANAGNDRHLPSVHMVDVGDKTPTERRAKATAWVKLSEQALAAIVSDSVPKGSVIPAAQLAGINAAKRTSEILPLCHTLGEISVIDVEVTPNQPAGKVELNAFVRAFGRTGVEMEALCAVTAAALSIYDMCKALDPAMEIGGVKLLEKRGGKSGEWRNPQVEK